MNRPQVQRLLYRIQKSNFLKFGLPMICFVVIGSYGLAEFTAIKVKRRDEKTRMLTAEEMLQFRKKADKVDVEEEWKRIQEMDIDTWENKRGPRPWEE